MNYFSVLTLLILGSCSANRIQSASVIRSTGGTHSEGMAHSANVDYSADVTHSSSIVRSANVDYSADVTHSSSIVRSANIAHLASALKTDRPFGFEPLYQEGSTSSYFESPETLVAIFPVNIYGNENSGFSFGAKLGIAPIKTISYEFKFDADFDFVKGGKLPGLCGGKGGRGGIKARGDNGFSARVMWRKEGRLVSYVYHLDQKGDYGDDFEWQDEKGKPIWVSRGAWHKLEMTVGINTLGKNNGFIKTRLDGVLVFFKSDFTFRTDSNLNLDRLCFNAFFGGDSQTWAPHQEQKLWIRNLKVKDEL